MELVNPSKLRLTVMSAKDKLDEVADLVQTWDCEEDADSFREAIDNYDVKVVNQVLDKTVAALMNGESVSDALYHFVEKFCPRLCDAVLDEPLEFRKIIIINQQYDELKRRFDDVNGR